MKRSITIIVTTGALIVGTVAGWAAAGFTDVPDNSPHAPAIEWAVDAGIISGKTADTFDPGGPLTRAQMVTILHRYHNAFDPKVIDYKEADIQFLANTILRVGTDIQPGIYTVEHGRSCQITRFSGFLYTQDEIIWRYTAGNAGRMVLKIEPTDVAVQFDTDCD